MSKENQDDLFEAKEGKQPSKSWRSWVMSIYKWGITTLGVWGLIGEIKTKSWELIHNVKSYPMVISLFHNQLTKTSYIKLEKEKKT